MGIFSKTVPLMAIVCLFSVSCNRNMEFRGYAQGGTYCVKADFRGTGIINMRSVSKQIDNLLTELDTTFSGYNKNSMLSRFNERKKIVPSAMFLDLLAKADSFKAASGGAFDHYSAPLFDIWGFGFKNDTMPSPEKIQEAMAECKKCTTLNFNAIAQGYSCDVIAAYLESLGVSNYLVDIGEIRCKGHSPSHRNWNIAIDTPFDGNETPGKDISGIWTSDGKTHGVVTSGNYRKFYIRDGKKYSHTIDPRSGMPVQHNLLSATVIAPDATEADAVATWLMVIGFDKAKEKILSDDRLEACLITSDEVWKSPGFQK